MIDRKRRALVAAVILIATQVAALASGRKGSKRVGGSGKSGKGSKYVGGRPAK